MEGEREGQKHQCVVASHTPPTGDIACNPGMCPHWELNWRPFGSQASAQSTELHQPGPGRSFLKCKDHEIEARLAWLRNTKETSMAEAK